jgi:hypothetical protein
MNAKGSNSVGHTKSQYSWVKENISFFFMRLNGLRNKEHELKIHLEEINAYAKSYLQVTGQNLADANILEIGFGARPNRLIMLTSLGYRARGIDLDRPILKGSVTEFLEVFKKNGFIRFVKSVIRHALFDVHERRVLRRVIKSSGGNFKVDESKFLVGDASNFEFPPGSLDFIYSEDVFEHIPLSALHTLCKNLSASMSENGLALISPAVYSGIAGGHLVEWYPHTLDSRVLRCSEPWEHLRKRRYHADCFLNELRVHEFEDIFKQYFNVVDIQSINHGMGAQYLTDELREELSDYETVELLSHKWTFVLRSKSMSNV